MATMISRLSWSSLILYPTARVLESKTWEIEQLTETETRTPRVWGQPQIQAGKVALSHPRDVNRRCEGVQPDTASPQVFPVPFTR